MYNISHGCHGVNPGAKLTGNILVDKRVFGCVEFGLGFQDPAWGVVEVLLRHILMEFA